MNIEELLPRNSPLIIAAAYFAFGAHGSIDQKRKYTGEPYVVHCFEVARILDSHTSLPVSDEQIAAAILHDVVEDSPVTTDVIHSTFGSTVGTLVDWLTDVSKPTDGNRKKRKQMDLQHTALAPPEAKTIKLADLCSNAQSITVHDPDFAHVWLREKANLLKVLQDGDPQLFSYTTDIHQNCLKQLGITA